MTKLFTTIAFMLLAATAFAGGNYAEEVQTGECNSYLRMPAATISNPYAQYPAPSIEMTTEKQFYGTACPTTAIFQYRTNVSAAELAGKRYPMFNPQTGVEIPGAYADGDVLYVLMYSTWRMAEAKKSGTMGFLYLQPETICYTTNAADPICKLPVPE